jgi:hypothetical protein
MYGINSDDESGLSYDPRIKTLKKSHSFGHSRAPVYSTAPYMKEHIRLDGLLVSSDSQVLSVMNRILTDFAIEAEVCSESIAALAVVTHRRLDTVIVDWERAHNPIRVISAARQSSTNSNSTIVALVSQRNEMQAALLAGANFIIHKPPGLDHASLCMRAAYGTMLLQRRRAARCVVEIPVVVTVAELGRLDAKVIDISIGGLALQSNPPLKVNWTVSLKFALPDTDDLVHVTGRIVNVDGAGRSGVSFSFIPEPESDQLVDWLATAIAEPDSTGMFVSDILES